MLSITNPMLKRLMLEQIIELIDGGAMDELLEAGFSGEFLDSLRHRPARDLIKIADNPALGFRASVHEADVVSYLNRLDAMRRDDQRLEYFVRNGAPLRMICDYFRMSKEDVRALRNQLLSPDELSERDRMPSDEVRDAIHAHWHAITVTQPS